MIADKCECWVKYPNKSYKFKMKNGDVHIITLIMYQGRASNIVKGGDVNIMVAIFDLSLFITYTILGVSFTALGFVSSILYRRLK